MSTTKTLIDADDALSLLVVQPEYDAGGGPGPCVHTFRTGTLMLGAHWALEDVEAAMREHDVYQLDPAVIDHGLYLVDVTGPVVFESVSV